MPMMHLLEMPKALAYFAVNSFLLEEMIIRMKKPKSKTTGKSLKKWETDWL